MSVVFQSVASADSGKTSGTALTMTSEVLIPKGSTIVFRITYDNTSNGTTSPAPAPGTVTSSLAGAFTGLTLRGARGSGSASGAGVNLAVWTATAAVDIPAGTNFTITVAASVAARAISMQYAGGTTFASAVTAGGTSGSGTITIPATNVTQVATATIAREYNETTTYGAVAGWEQGILEGTKGGNALTNVSMMSARKYPVGTVGNHTWNPSGTSGDWSAVGILFNDTSPSVSTVTPASSARGTATVLTLTGLNLTGTNRVTLEGIDPTVEATSFTVNSATSITATFNTSNMSLGQHTLRVYANGAYSDGDAFTLTDPPMPPNPITNFRVDWDHYYKKEINLAWTSPGSTVNIEISRNGAVIATLAPGVTKYRDANLTLGNTYTYSMRAYNGLGEQTASLAPHTLKTRMPSVGYTSTQVRAASTNHVLTMPPTAEVRPYDIIFLAVQKANTTTITANPSSEWSEWPPTMNASTAATGTLWYYRVQPSASDPSVAIIPTATLSLGTSTEITVAMMVIKDTDVYTNEFWYKEPYSPYLGVSTTNEAANLVKTYGPMEGMSGSGLMMHYAGVTASASTASLVWNHLDPGDKLLSPTNTTARNFIRISSLQMPVIGEPFDPRYSVNVVASHVQNVLWFPEAAVAKSAFTPASMYSQSIATSMDLNMGTGTPATGDLVLISLTTASGTGAINCTVLNSVGFTAPVKFFDSTNTHPSIRTVMWTSYGTAATNSATLMYRFTYPSSHTYAWGTMIKNVGNVTPIVVSKASTGPDSLTIDIPQPAFLAGNVGTIGLPLGTAGYHIPSSEGWTSFDSGVAESGVTVTGITSRGAGPSPSYGNFIQFGEAHAAGTATWTTDLPPTYNNSVLRTLVAFPASGLHFGNSSTDAIVPATLQEFFAFGIPL